VTAEARAAARPDEGQHRRTAARRAELRVTLLDQFAVTVDGAEVKIPAIGQRLVALAALCGPLPRPRVVSLLWPHLRQQPAAASLRTALSRLRAVCPSVLVDDYPWLRLAPGIAVDARELEARAIRATASGGDVDIDVSVHHFTAELLPGWDDDWVLDERDRLRELCLHAIEAHATMLREANRFAQAMNTAYAAKRLDPHRESPMRLIIEIHLAEGNRAQAARCYVQFRKRLRTAMRMEPSEEMRALIAPLMVETPRR
jgi:DNA-binding SARP family transcriptional activator